MKRFIGNREFYKLVAALALPLLMQNAVSTFVNLLDNLMVGRIGTESMSGVSIVNQLLFVYNLCLFGGSGGAGIFGAQFFGRASVCFRIPSSGRSCMRPARAAILRLHLPKGRIISASCSSGFRRLP